MPAPDRRRRRAGFISDCERRMHDMRILSTTGDYRRLAAGGAGLLGCLLMAGCGGSPVNEAISGQIERAIGTLSPPTLQVRIINQDIHIKEVELLADGTMFRLSCSPEQQVCDFLMPTCPSYVELIQERQFNDQGWYLGGRLFHGQYIYHNPGDFTCGSVLILKFSDLQLEAMVL
jgi:hypothetical protein